MSGLSTISNTDLPKVILQNLFHKKEFCRKVLPFVKLEYFDVEDGTRVAYELFLDFITKYNALPNQKALEVEFANSDKNTEANANVLSLIESLFVDKSSLDVNDEWLYTTTEKWCQDRAVYLAVLKSINIIDGKDSDSAPGAIPEILSKALSVTFDRNIGHDYIDNADERFEYYHTVEEKVEFDLELLNKITKGGVSNKTLNVILAGCVHPDTKVKIRYRKPS